MMSHIPGTDPQIAHVYCPYCDVSMQLDVRPLMYRDDELIGVSLKLTCPLCDYWYTKNYTVRDDQYTTRVS